MSVEATVLFDEMPGLGGDIGVITLNRPAALNALNHEMMLLIYPQLQEWAVAKHIKAVVIRPVEGRAFCAGGDIRMAYERRLANDSRVFDFFRDEYQLNRFIFHFPKPYIALLDGITMGGGVGISLHGSHRVATDKLLFAMPETGIGFFPDVGGTYFLPRLPDHIGYYLGLTGARIASDDCVSIGIAQTKIDRASLAPLMQRLADEPFVGDARVAVSNIINEFSIPAEQATLTQYQADIEACFKHRTMEEIEQSLQQLNSTFCQETLTMLAKKSPTSLKVTLRALQEGARLDFDMCMQQEFNLTSHFLHGHDFIEGIRAVIIDKDQQPQWKPTTLAAVTDHDVAAYF
jgi:enoyl-CoA hydratase